MIKRLADWYRIVNMAPSDDLLEKRKSAITELVGALKSGADEKLAAAVQFVLTGKANPADVVGELAAEILETIKKHQITVREDVSESIVELRVCCSVAIGEMLLPSKKSVISRSALVVAALMISGTGIGRSHAEPQFQGIVNELLNLAVTSSELSALAARKRSSGEVDALGDLAAAQDIPDLAKRIYTAMSKELARLHKQISADREEIDLLWWMYNKHSERFDRPIFELEPGVASLASGYEFAERIVFPSLNSTRRLLTSVAEAGRTLADGQLFPLELLISQWDAAARAVMVPNDDTGRDMAQQFPAVFPLTWIALRITDSQGSQTWMADFEARTGISPSSTVRIGQCAVQVFNEQGALSLVAPNEDDEAQ
jgi:hypothetical protein